MTRSIFSLGLLAGLLCAGAAPAAMPQTVAFGRFGTVPVLRPVGAPTQVVLLVSGEGGWTARESALADALSSWGALVLELDGRRYLSTAAGVAGHGGDRCLYPAADLENLSQFAQKRLALPTYRPPLLVGTGSAATLVYATLAQAPPDTFAGAVSFGFCAHVPAGKPLCHGNALRWHREGPAAGYRLQPAPDLESPWALIEIPGQECAAGPGLDFAAAIPKGRTLQLATATGTASWSEALHNAFDGIDAAARERQETAAARPASLKGLPLVEVPAVSTLPAIGPAGDVLAVIVSGSGGWGGLDRQLGKSLSERGTPVVGINSLQYFWHTRDPDGASRDLAHVLDHYLAAWHKSQALVIGYSQGADVVPFMADRLPAALRSKVRLVALIGPDGAADFAPRFGAWMRGKAAPPELPVAPEVPRLAGIRVLCIFGSEETKSMCRSLAPGLADRLELATGHGFNGEAPHLADTFLTALPGQPGQPGRPAAPTIAPAQSTAPGTGSEAAPPAHP